MEKLNQARVLKIVTRLNVLLYGALLCLFFAPLFDFRKTTSALPPSAFVGLSALIFFVLAFICGHATLLILRWKLNDNQSAYYWTAIALFIAPFVAFVFVSFLCYAPLLAPIWLLVIPISFATPFVFCIFAAKE